MPHLPSRMWRSSDMQKPVLFSKRLLCLSGIAFLLLITPAWPKGMVCCGVFCVLLCICVFRLRLPSCRCTAALFPALVICSGFGMNFYDNWLDSRYVAAAAGLLRLPSAALVVGGGTLLVLLSLPAAAAVLHYYYTKASAVFAATDEGSGLSFRNSVLLLFAVYLLGLSALLRANFYYLDDLGRAFYGYKQWDYYSRFVSHAAAPWVHMGSFLPDVAPLTQLLAAGEMAFGGVLVLFVLYGRKRFSLPQLLCTVSLGLNPLFLECFAFRYDAPYMALSVVSGVVPLLFRKRNTTAYVFAVLLGMLTVCCTYQASLGVFPMLVLLLCLRQWCRGEKFLPFLGQSVGGFLSGLVFFKLVLMRPIHVGYVTNTIFPIKELIPGSLSNLFVYYSYIFRNFPPLWTGLCLLCGAGFVCFTASGSLRRGLAALLTLSLMSLGCFGLYPALAGTLTAPRAMYGFCIMISLLGVVCAEIPSRWRLAPLVLTWSFFVFSFAYGNALNAQREYADFRIAEVISDLSDMEIFAGEQAIPVQVQGGIGHAPQVRQMAGQNRMLSALVPVCFDGSDDLTLYRFFLYYDLRNVSWDMGSDFSGLPLSRNTMYHTIYSDGTRVRIDLK